MITLNGGLNFGNSGAGMGGFSGQVAAPGAAFSNGLSFAGGAGQNFGAITNGVSLNDNALNFANGSNNIGSLLGSVNVFQSPESLLGVSKILAPGGVDLGDSNTNFTASLLSQANFYTINSGQSQTSQVLGQLGNTLKNGGASTPLTINLNDFKQVNGQIDPSALASAQAVLGTSSLKGNFFFDQSSNAKIQGRPVNPLAGLLGGIGGSFAGVGSNAGLGGLGQGALALLSQGQGAGFAGGGVGVGQQATGGNSAALLQLLAGLQGQGTGTVAAAPAANGGNSAALTQVLLPLLQQVLAAGQQGQGVSGQLAQRSISAPTEAPTVNNASAGVMIMLLLTALSGMAQKR